MRKVSNILLSLTIVLSIFMALPTTLKAATDTTPPVLESLAWSKNNIILPYFLEIKGKIKDDSSLLSYKLYLTQGENEDEFVFQGNSYWKDDSFTSNMPLKRYGTPTTISLQAIELVDKANNVALYCSETSKSKYQAMPTYANLTLQTLPDIGKLTLINPQKYDKMLSSKDTDYIQKLSLINEGSTVVIDIADNTLIKKELFETIKGKNIQLIFEDVSNAVHNTNGIQWVMNGKDINEPSKDVDMKTSIKLENLKRTEPVLAGIAIPTQATLLERNEFMLEQLKVQTFNSWYYQYLLGFDKTKDDFFKLYDNEVHKNDYLDIKFEDNGTLPGKVKVRIRLDYALRFIILNDNVYAYYKNGDVNDLVKDHIKMQEDGSYEFIITHNSNYILTTEKLHKDIPETKPEAKPETKPEVKPEVKPNDTGDKKTNTGDNTGNHEITPNTADTSYNIIFAFMSVFSLGVLLFVVNRVHKTNK
ncbi:MAG: hypothetical protein RR847_05230 [Bacilli bacterium]